MNRLNLFLLVVGFAAVLISNAEARLEHRIVGGDIAKEGRYSYMVSLQSTAVKRNKCGGAIIDKRHIITAAHCVTTPENEFVNTPMRIVGGFHYLMAFPKNLVIADVDKIYIPKEFNRAAERISADVAIIRLKDDLPLETSPKLSKLELPEEGSITGERAVITGYGSDWISVQKDKDTGALKEVGGGTNSMLRVAEVDIISTEKCNKIFYITPVTEKHICGALVQRNPTKHEGICSGDSGGPLVSDGKTLIGLVSTSSFGCTEHETPAVYTKVSAYLDFINKAVNDKDNDPEIRSITL